MINRKKFWLYLASAIIPCGIYLITLMLLNAVPFGDSTIIISDANGQYIDFASYWQSVLSGESSLFYTFSKTLGGDGLNLAAYYLLSPINLIFLFSNLNNLPLLYTIVIVLKVSLCGLTFFHSSAQFYGYKHSNLLFSTAYALMAYNVVYVWNIMWLDGIIILPLLVLGLYRVLEAKSPWLYVISLMYALATNFYIGYMLCIAAVLFCVSILTLKKQSWKLTGALFGRFSVASIIGGFGSAVIWLPAFLSIAGERSQTNAFEVTFDRSFGLLSFPSKFFCGAASPQDIMGGLPNIFCGTAILLLVAIFFLDDRRPLRQKLVGASNLIILFLSFFFLLPNTVWHGFSPTNAFNFRYSFLFSFVLIVIAQHQFEKKDSISAKAVIPATVLLLGVLGIAIVRKPHFLQAADILITLAVLIFCAICLLLSNKSEKVAIVLFCTIGILELGLNCIISWNAIQEDSWALNASEFSSYVQSTHGAVDYIKENDDGFYRLEKTFYRSNNDAAMFGYNGLSHFSSTEPVFVKSFMRKMGFSSYYDFWSAYTAGSTAEVDSLLGVKYLLSRDNLSDAKKYPLVATVNGIHIYKNENALPLAVLSDDSISSIDMEETDRFMLHNAIWQGLTGSSSEILERESFTVTTQNLIPTQLDDGSTLYQKQDPSQSAVIRYEISISQENPLYYYFTAPYPQNVRIFINGQDMGLYFDRYSWNMNYAGSYTPGDVVIIELCPAEDSIAITQPFFYYENTEILDNLSAAVKQQDLQFTQLSDSHFYGNLNAKENQLLLFTIPYSNGWHLRVDGKNTPLVRIMDAFLAADVTPGSHEFELQYIPTGLYPGACLVPLAIVLSAVWYYTEKKRKQ